MPGETASNPDQRIHEDARHLTELSADLGIGAPAVFAPDAIRKRDLPFERAQLRHSRLHGLVRPGLRGHRLQAQLARRAARLCASAISLKHPVQQPRNDLLITRPNLFCMFGGQVG
jgi:hypothetical protein